MEKKKSKSAETRKKSNAGRPSKMTQEVLGKLEHYLSRGTTIPSACAYAGIDLSTFYDWKSNNKEFSEQLEVWQNDLNARAKLLVSDAIDKGDVQTAKWVLEKTDKAYNPKHLTEVTGENGGDISIAFKWQDE